MAVSLSVNPIDANKDINVGATSGITIAGTSSDSILANLVGQTVSVVLNSRTYTGATGSDGSSSVNVGITIPIKTVNSNGFINCPEPQAAVLDCLTSPWPVGQ